MIDTLLITFREGLEAFLIVAITLAYLTKTNRLALIPAVYAGVGVAILLSSYIGYRIGDCTPVPRQDKLDK
jgi:high-affinity iron transporter